MHMWIGDMYAHVASCGTIARFSCFALEGIALESSHVRLKLLRTINGGGGVSLVNNKSALCVVDNHTLDYNIRKEGWKVESKAVTKQRGFHYRCRTLSRA